MLSRSIMLRTACVAVAAAVISISVSTGIRYLVGAQADGITVAVRIVLPFIVAIPLGLIWFSKLEKLETNYRDLLRKTNALMKVAGTDPLTGLRNRRSFTEQFDIARSHGVDGTFIIADLDYLKQINDRHGHLAGDDAIVAAATALYKVLGDDALIARIGGDEFCSFLPSRRYEEIGELVSKINRAATEEFVLLSGLKDVTISMSVGKQRCTAGQTFRDIIAQSDHNLYTQKRSRPDKVKRGPAAA